MIDRPQKRCAFDAKIKMIEKKLKLSLLFYFIKLIILLH